MFTNGTSLNLMGTGALSDCVWLCSMYCSLSTTGPVSCGHLLLWVLHWWTAARIPGWASPPV